MKIARRRMLQLLAASAGIAASAGARAQSKGGTEFPFKTLNPPQPIEAEQGKVEVIEFFWYGCPHCYALEPSLEAWLKKLPNDVAFRRVAAPLGQSWIPHTQAYYAFEALGVLPKVHRAFFDAIHRDRLRVESRPAMEQWLQKNDITPAKFDETVRSFGVQSSVRKAGRMAGSYQIDGVPAFAVQGRYTVGAADIAIERLIPAVDQMIGLARSKPKGA